MLNRKRIDADFCVVGGGMSGICAAISAARKGLKVVLMHERPVLGGNASSEIRMWICGAHGTDNRETGIIEEIMLENLYRNPTKNYHIWDTVLYEFVMREKNIQLLLNCTCLDAKCETGQFKHGRSVQIKEITGYQLTTQTYIDVTASFFADCSGDSILAPLTGAEFMLGREGKAEFGEDTHVEEHDKMTMGMSCLLQGRETTQPIKFIPPSYAAKLTEEDFNHRDLNIYKEGENFWYLELGGDRDSIHDTEEISRELAGLAAGTWDYVKNSGNIDADNWELEFLGFLPGKRESRRMTGEYILTQPDISNDTKFEDAVAFGGWPIDDHYPGGFYHRGTPNTDIKTNYPYEIPYRCLYSKNVDNLFFAGRNISATHFSMSSTRVMATCALMGQAVGTAVSVICKYDCTPHDAYLEHMDEVQDILLNDDCFLPNKTRRISDICRNISENPAICDGRDRIHEDIYKEKGCGMSVDNGKSIEYKFGKAEKISAVHIVFDSDLRRDTLPGGDCERTHATRCNIRLDSPQMYVPKTLCREFVLKYETADGEKTIHITENRKRAYHIEIDEPIVSLSLTPVSNWGESEKTNVFSFDF